MIHDHESIGNVCRQVGDCGSAVQFGAQVVVTMHPSPIQPETLIGLGSLVSARPCPEYGPTLGGRPITEHHFSYVPLLAKINNLVSNMLLVVRHPLMEEIHTIYILIVSIF